MISVLMGTERKTKSIVLVFLSTNYMNLASSGISRASTMFAFKIKSTALYEISANAKIIEKVSLHLICYASWFRTRQFEDLRKSVTAEGDTIKFCFRKNFRADCFSSFFSSRTIRARKPGTNLIFLVNERNLIILMKR